MPRSRQPAASKEGVADQGRSTTLSRALVGIAALVASLSVGFRIQAAIDERAPVPGGGAGGPCTIWFVGSSTIHKWRTLAQDLRPWDARNRGRNGALIAEIATRLKRDAGSGPAAIVFYGGENDLAAGLTPDRALADLHAIVAFKRARYGATPIFLVSQKPSPTRWNLLAEQRAYNAGIGRSAGGQPDIRFIDVAGSFLVNGRPGPYYVEDGIHLNPAGYAILTTHVAAALTRDLPMPLADRCGAGATRR